MHFEILALAISILLVAKTSTALPAHLSHQNVNLAHRSAHTTVILHRRSTAGANLQKLSCQLAAGDAENKQIEAAAGEGVGSGEGEGEEAAPAANEVEIEATFDVAVPVAGGDLKQDLVFTPSTVGKFEYEFQAATADEVTVTEKSRGSKQAPAGFEAIEPNSYVVSLAQSKGVGLSLSKIDYIFDTASAGLAGKDITQAQVGRLCAETGAFVISETLGELEFELEENEVTLNLNKNVAAEGEWGIFLPIAAAAAAPAEAVEGSDTADSQVAPEAKSKATAKAHSTVSLD
ncbi:hypothetical protein N0V83_003695 [Neocucurbitaria cava]|uniref:Accumulation-associated protein n=1 Tax=Neocucurbitaria cava TaxID=798079 RepID=A0A9W8YBV9_9PLEO|nr:hypothetical protein N0V83_003695 [Neocucurbitaria cava]